MQEGMWGVMPPWSAPQKAQVSSGGCSGMRTGLWVGGGNERAVLRQEGMNAWNLGFAQAGVWWSQCLKLEGFTLGLKAAAVVGTVLGEGDSLRSTFPPHSAALEGTEQGLHCRDGGDPGCDSSTRRGESTKGCSWLLL